MRVSSYFISVVVCVASVVFSAPRAYPSGNGPMVSGDGKQGMIQVLKVWKEKTPEGPRLFVHLRIRPEPVPGKPVFVNVLVNGKKRAALRIARKSPTIILPFLPGPKDGIAFVPEKKRSRSSDPDTEDSGLCDDAGSTVRISPDRAPAQVFVP